MTALALSARMEQVTHWLRDVAVRPSSENDYQRAQTSPMSQKRFYDRCTLGAVYLARHSCRNIQRGHIGKGVAQALPIPALAVATFVFPFGPSFVQLVSHKKLRSPQGTLEDTIAFNLKYARSVAEDLARDDRVQMLKAVRGTSRDDLRNWAVACFAAARKVQDDIDTSCERIRKSKLIQRQMKKLLTCLIKIWSLCVNDAHTDIPDNLV